MFIEERSQVHKNVHFKHYWKHVVCPCLFSFTYLLFSETWSCASDSIWSQWPSDIKRTEKPARDWGQESLYDNAHAWFMKLFKGGPVMVNVATETSWNAQIRSQFRGLGKGINAQPSCTILQSHNLKWYIGLHHVQTRLGFQCKYFQDWSTPTVDVVFFFSYVLLVKWGPVGLLLHLAVLVYLL